MRAENETALRHQKAEKKIDDNKTMPMPEDGASSGYRSMNARWWRKIVACKKNYKIIKKSKWRYYDGSGGPDGRGTSLVESPVRIFGTTGRRGVDICK